MLKNIALAAVVVFAVGCGAARQSRPTQAYSEAANRFGNGETLDDIAVSMSLRDRDQAESYVAQGILDMYDRLQDLR